MDFNRVLRLNLEEEKKVKITKSFGTHLEKLYGNYKSLN